MKPMPAATQQSVSRRMRRRAVQRRRQRGVTLVELMVALVLGLLVAGAAVASLLIARQGFTSVDGSTQLRENARFAASLIERVAIQSGFQDVANGQFPNPVVPAVQGFDNALVLAGGLINTFPPALAHGSRTAANCGVANTSCMNGSDVLILRHWGVSLPPGPGNPADGSMIDCAGNSVPERSTALGPSYSVFHVVRSPSTLEPTLACSTQDAVGVWTTVPLVQGVEGMQVLYGTDGVVPGIASAAPTAANPVTRYLRAPDLDVGGLYNANNWARVRSIRIGLLLRGPPNAVVDAAATARTWSVLTATGAAYPFSTAADVGSALAIPTADGRLRQQLVFTVFLRNFH